MRWRETRKCGMDNKLSKGYFLGIHFKKCSVRIFRLHTGRWAHSPSGIKLLKFIYNKYTRDWHHPSWDMCLIVYLSNCIWNMFCSVIIQDDGNGITFICGGSQHASALPPRHLYIFYDSLLIFIIYMYCTLYVFL